MNDPWNLQRFVDAQDTGGTYDAAARELRNGRKETHWMWFVFPQITGLGRSPAAQLYAISGLPEARAFLGHPVLGPRLTECARIIDELAGLDAVAIFGSIDAQKLHSSMTLFARADPGQPVFQNVLAHYFAGEADDATVRSLASPPRP